MIDQLLNVPLCANQTAATDAAGDKEVPVSPPAK